MKILLFTGAGTSRPSRLPSTEEITESVMNGKWKDRPDIKDGRIFQPSDESSDKTVNVQRLLKQLELSANKYFMSRSERKANYEDLYYLVRQFCEDEVRTHENPAIEKFIDELKLQMRNISGGDDLKVLAGDCCSLIYSVVSRKLSQEGESIEGLNLVDELAKDSSIKKLDICTLNHDLLFEKFLKANHEVNDGFAPVSKNAKFRVFDCDNFNALSMRIRLFKLHGSINWYCLERNQRSLDYPRIATPLQNENPRDCEDSGFKLKSLNPVLLTGGTYNKLAAYGSFIYADLNHWFHRLLREHDTILVSGYGWGDGGINQRLLEWFFLSPKNRMVLMYDENKDIFGETLRQTLPELIKKGRVLLTGKRMQHTRAEDIFNLPI